VSELDWQETRNLTLRSPSMAQGDGEGKFEGELRITAEECQHFTGVHFSILPPFPRIRVSSRADEKTVFK